MQKRQKVHAKVFWKVCLWFCYDYDVVFLPDLYLFIGFYLCMYWGIITQFLDALLGIISLRHMRSDPSCVLNHIRGPWNCSVLYVFKLAYVFRLLHLSNMPKFCCHVLFVWSEISPTSTKPFYAFHQEMLYPSLGLSSLGSQKTSHFFHLLGGLCWHLCFMEHKVKVPNWIQKNLHLHNFKKKRQMSRSVENICFCSYHVFQFPRCFFEKSVTNLRPIPPLKKGNLIDSPPS